MSATKNINAEKIQGSLTADTINIQTLGSGTSVTNLGIDSSGNVVTGTTGGGGDNFYITGFTYNDANTLTISQNGGLGNLTSTINTVTGLTVTNYVDFETQSNPSNVSGRTFFDRSENALSYFPQTPSNDVTINIGQESVIRVHNNTGSQINNGQACHITSTQPSVQGVPSMILAIATGDTSNPVYEVSGIATHDIPDGTEGFITAFGIVRDLSITGVSEGSEIYLSDTIPGGLIYQLPSDPDSRVSQIGWLIQTGSTDAKILVQLENEVGFNDLSTKRLSIIAENNSSTGLRVGGEMSINSGDNTLFDVTAGSGTIVDNFTNPENPVITSVVWDNLTGLTVTNLTGDSGSFIFLDSNLNTVQYGISNPPTSADYRDNIYLGILGHTNFTNIINTFNTPIPIVSPINQIQDIALAIGPFSITGNRLTGISGSLKLEKGSGRSFSYGGNFHTDTKVPSVVTSGLLSGNTLNYATGTNILGPTSTNIDPNNYDPNGLGTITSTPGSKYVAHRVWHNPQQNILIFQYGQYNYNNIATAKEEFSLEKYIVPPGLSENAYLVAIMIVQDGETDLDNSIIIPQGKFAGSGGGGGGSVDTLQTAYNNSSSPEITTDVTRGAVDFRVGSGSDSDNVVTFQQNSGTINAYVQGTGDAEFNNLTGSSITSNSEINVFNGHVNLRDNSYFLQGRTGADVNVSLIGVDNQDRVFVGNAGYDTYIDSNTIVNGSLTSTTLYSNTISASTYQNLPIDPNYYVTGGTYNSGTTSIDYSGNFGFTPFSVNVSSLIDGLWSQSGSSIYYSGGNVGIGTTTPTGNLDISNGTDSFIVDLDDVNGPTAFVRSSNPDDRIRLAVSTLSASISMGMLGSSATGSTTFGGPNDAYILASSVANNLNIINTFGAGNEDSINFYAGNNATSTPHVHIHGSGSTKGYVGIGTTTPSEKLEVSGNTIISGTLNIGTLGTGTSVNNLGVDVNGNVVSGNTNTGIYGGDGTIPLNTTASVNGDLTFQGLDEDTRIILKDGNNGGEVHLFSDGSAGQSSLEFYNPGGASLTSKIQNAGGDTRFISNNRDLLFTTNTGVTTEGLFIEAGTGNMGIGTTTPQVELHVKGDSSILRLETTSLTNNNYIEFWDPTERKGFFGYVSTASIDSLFLRNEEHDAKIIISSTDSSGTSRTAINIDGNHDVQIPNGNFEVVGTLNIGTIGSGTPVGNLGFDSNGQVVTGTTAGGDSNSTVENFYYSISNSVDTRPIFEDTNVLFDWDETGNDLEFQMKVAPGGSGDMRSLAYLVGGSTQNTSIVSTGVNYDVYAAGVSAGNRLEVFITAENDVTYPAYHVIVYNTGESVQNTIWIQRITRN